MADRFNSRRSPIGGNDGNPVLKQGAAVSQGVTLADGRSNHLHGNSRFSGGRADARLSLPGSASGELPVKLIAVTLLAQLFADAPKDSIFRLMPTAPHRVFFLLLLLAWAFRPSNSHDKSSDRRSGKTELYLMMVYGVILTFSWAITGIDFQNDDNRWFATLYAFNFCPLGMYLVVRGTKYSRAALVALLRAMIGIGVYITVSGLCQHYKINFLVWPRYMLEYIGDQRERLQGPLGNSAHMGEWLIVTFICVSLAEEFRKTKSTLLTNLFKLALMACIYLTETRSIWVDFGIVLTITLVFAGAKWRKQSMFVIVMLLLGFVLGVGSKFSLGEGTIFSKRSETLDYRAANFEVGMKIGMSNFLFGAGYGSFSREWRKYFGGEELESVRDLNSGNENTYIGLFSEVGIVGLLLYVSLLVRAFIRCLSIRARLRSEQEFERQFVLMTMALFLMAFFQGWFGDLRFALAFNTILFLFFGIVVSMDPGASDPSEALAHEAR